MFVSLKTVERLNFSLACFTFLFCFIGFNWNVDAKAVSASIYNFMWIPIAVLMIILPFSSLILWIKGRFCIHAFNIYSFLLMIFTWGTFFYKISSIQC